MGEYGFREENAYVLQGLSLCLEFTYGELAPYYTNSLYFCLNNPYLPNELAPSAYHSKGQKRNCAYPGNTKWAMQQQRKKKKMILRVTRKSVKEI